MFSIQNHATSPSFSSPKDLQLGIISTSPCLFCFPENSQKNPESFEIFVVSSSPRPGHTSSILPAPRPRPRHEAASCAFTCWPNIWVRTKETRLLPRRILGSFQMQVVGVAGFSQLFSVPNIRRNAWRCFAKKCGEGENSRVANVLR